MAICMGSAIISEETYNILLDAGAWDMNITYMDAEIHIGSFSDAMSRMMINYGEDIKHAIRFAVCKM